MKVSSCFFYFQFSTQPLRQNVLQQQIWEHQQQLCQQLQHVGFRQHLGHLQNCLESFRPKNSNWVKMQSEKRIIGTQNKKGNVFLVKSYVVCNYINSKCLKFEHLDFGAFSV